MPVPALQTAAQGSPRTSSRRPDVDAVATIALRLLQEGTTVTIPMLVGEILRETTCSRATAYRAVTDALKAGALQTAPRETAGQQAEPAMLENRQ